MNCQDLKLDANWRRVPNLLCSRETEMLRGSQTTIRTQKRETYMLATGPCLCIALWRRADQGLCGFHFNRVMRGVWRKKPRLEYIVGWWWELI